MAVNDTYMLSVRGTCGGTMHVHTLHFRETATVTGEAGLLTSWQGAPMTAYRAIFPTSQLPVQLIKAQKICGSVPLPASVEVIPAGGSQAGTRSVAGDIMPSFMAACVTEKTALAGKRYQGRFFLGGMAEADCVGNSLQASLTTVINAYNAALMTAYGGGGGIDFRLVVHSKANASQVGMNCQGSSELVTSLVTIPFPTTMRSRKSGHGP